MAVLPNCCVLPLELLPFDIKHFLSGGKLAQTSFEYLWKTFIPNSTSLTEIKIVSLTCHALLNFLIKQVFPLKPLNFEGSWNKFLRSVSSYHIFYIIFFWTIPYMNRRMQIEIQLLAILKTLLKRNRGRQLTLYV